MKMKHELTTEFDVGQKVFINVPGSEPHLITDVVFRLKDKTVRYEIMDSRGYKGYYSKHELSDCEIFK